MLDDKIRAAVEPLVPVCVPDLYTGDAEEYCTYNYNEIPAAFGNNRPHAVRYLVQVHWFLPLKKRPHPKKRKLVRALGGIQAATWPTVVNASDELGQHFVYEFEAVERMAVENGEIERKRDR